MTLQDREVDGTFESCQSAFRHRREWGLSESRNWLNRDIQVSGLDLRTEGSTGKLLLQDAELRLLRGRHYGLVGRNGVGKSTLMRMIADHRIHGMWRHLRCVYIDDTTTVDAALSPNTTSVQHLLSRHKEREELCRALQTELEGADSKTEHDVELIESIVRQLEVLRADAAESRARVVLLGLGLDPDGAIGTLSGGFLYRLALASALFLEVDVLLLDELTNQLDVEAQLWLQSYLAGVPSTVVLVSHDGLFLDAVVDTTICFEDQTLKYYDGNFSTFLRTRAQQLEKHRRMFIAQEARRKRIEQTIENLNKRAQAGDESRSRQIHSRKQQLKFRLGASMDGVYWKYGLMGPRPEVLAPPDEEPFVFDIPTDLSDIPFDADDGTDLIIAKQIGYTWPQPDQGGAPYPPLFDRLDLRIGLATRLILLGANGSGKTTLLRCLAGELKLTTGSFLRWDGLRVGYIAQSGILSLVSAGEEGLTALRYIMRKHGLSGAKEEKKARNCLGSFGLIGTVAEQQAIDLLSSGQRARVLFASVSLAKPHLLILDEPTNYLDQESHAAMISAFQAFEGGIVAATHDQQFAESIGVDFLVLSPGHQPVPVKDFDEYLAMTASRHTIPSAAPDRPGAPAAATQVSSVSRPSTSHPHPSTQPDSVTISLHSAPPVACRRCKGPHFTHQCPNPPAAEPTAQPTPPKLPPTRIKANDGGGDWQVAVSKSTRKRLQKAK